MTISVQRQEEYIYVQARRALLERELSRWLPLLITHEQPDKIILFGSYCAGRVSEWSDLDQERAFVRQEIVAKGRAIYERGN